MKTRLHTAAHARRHALRSLVLAAGLAALAPAHAEGPITGYGCRFVDPSGIEIAPAKQDAMQRLAVLRCERHAALRAQQDAARATRGHLESDALRLSRPAADGAGRAPSSRPARP
ncbi:MAG: hypothetical protein V4801_25565 [Burkholderia gladioli]